MLIIPYGTAEWARDGISLTSFSTQALRLRAAFPCVAINRATRQPLRFNNSRYNFGFAPDVQAGSADEADILREYLKGLCRPWDKLSAQFLDVYFRLLTELIEEHRDALSERLAAYAGLYHYRDWFFSAPKPLPRAHLHAPAEPSAAWATADFVRVDFAFWLGDRLVAAQSSQSSLTPKRAREETERLRLAGVDVVPFGPSDLEEARARDLVTRILGLAISFWDGDLLPSGPFQTPLLDA